MVAGVAANTRHDGHQRSQGDQLLDGALEQTNHPRGKKSRDQVDRQPRPAVTQGFPDRGKDIFFFTQTGHVEDFAFAFLTDQVDHFVNGQTANQLAVFVDHRRGDQVITFESLGRIISIFIRMETHRIVGHDFDHLLIGIIDQQSLDRQHPLECAIVVDHKKLVGMTWQLLEPTKITQHHFQADVFADGDHLEVHQRANLLLVIGQRRTNALTLLTVKGFHQLVDDVSRQLGGQVGELVGIHLLGGGQEFVIVHVGDQCFSYRVGNFKEDVAVTLGLDQLPDGQAIVQGQGFKDIGDVGGVQIVKLALQLDKVLPMNQVFYPILMQAFLTMSQIFDHSLAMQQLNDLSEAVLQAVW